MNQKHFHIWQIIKKKLASKIESIAIGRRQTKVKEVKVYWALWTMLHLYNFIWIYIIHRVFFCESNGEQMHNEKVILKQQKKQLHRRPHSRCVVARVHGTDLLRFYVCASFCIVHHMNVFHESAISIAFSIVQLATRMKMLGISKTNASNAHKQQSNNGIHWKWKIKKKKNQIKLSFHTAQVDESGQE